MGSRICFSPHTTLHLNGGNSDSTQVHLHCTVNLTLTIPTFFNDDSRAFKFWRVTNSCVIQKYDPLQNFQIQLLTEQYTCCEIGLSPVLTLFPQLTFTESDSFSYFTVEVAGDICIKVKGIPLFDEINSFSNSWCYSYSRKSTPQSTTPPASGKHTIIRVAGRKQFVSVNECNYPWSLG